MRKLLLGGMALLLLIPDHGVACLWNYETLSMERQRFPQSHELIAGYFIRHSRAYYEWCIADRSAKHRGSQTPMDFDDLAVAYDKLGQHDKAIATIQAKLERWPDERRYESEANLGTLLIHAGRLEEGLEHIKKAIELNPDAHFGREIYQQLLVEYLLTKGGTGASLPLDNRGGFERTGFAAFVLDRQKTEPGEALEELRRAAKGVLGMMRFGRYDSPILLEALGDLMLAENVRDNSRLLAARAYLKASYETTDSAASSAYRQKAEHALELKYGWEMSEVEEDLKFEIEQGNDLSARILRDEQTWAARGANLDEEFAKEYFAAPVLKLHRPDWAPLRPMTRIAFNIGSVIAVACLLGLIIYRRRARKRRNLSAA